MKWVALATILITAALFHAGYPAMAVTISNVVVIAGIKN